MNAQTTNSAQLVSLTENEKAFLRLCRNYDTAEEQRGDNYSNGGIDEAMELFAAVHSTRKAQRQAAGGLIASLTEKGMGSFDTEYDQFCLSEKGIVHAYAE